MTKRVTRPHLKTGRPRAVIDLKSLELMAKLGCTREEMAAELGCSVPTLDRRFDALIKSGKHQGRISLRRAQWKAALAGDRTMLVWLGKNELGQTDKHELGGTDGGPIRHEVIWVKPRVARRREG